MTDRKRAHGQHRGHGDPSGIIRSQYPGICSVCQRAYAAGARIVIVPGLRGWVHPQCAQSQSGRTGTELTALCGAPTTTGRPCRNPVLPGERCRRHRWEATETIGEKTDD